MQAAVVLEIDGGLARVILNRPDTLNALSPELVLGLAEVLDQVANDDAIRCVILQGQGDHFMAGGDLGFFAKWVAGESGLTSESEAALFHAVNQVILAITQMPKPVVAVVRGSAAGYGLSLVLACDLAMASSEAFFTTAYGQIGASPDGGMSVLLPSLIGYKRAMELLLLSDRFDAAQAHQWGLVNQVVAPSDLDDAVQALAQRLLQGSASAMAMTKQLTRCETNTALTTQLVKEAEAFRTLKHEADFSEGVRAFLEKRKPSFNQEVKDG